jgi:hypothetical protein
LTTKWPCEDIFGALQDVTRDNRNGAVGDFRAHQIASNAKCLHCTGCKILSLPDSDFDLDLELDRKLLKPDGHSFCKIDRGHEASVNLTPIVKEQSRKTWQTAGPAAWQRTISASEYIVASAELHFQGIESAWKARLFLEGFIFLRIDGAVFVSLGSSEFTWLGLQLGVVVQDKCRYISLGLPRLHS